MFEPVFIVKVGPEGYTVVTGEISKRVLEMVANKGEVTTYECPMDLLNAVLEYIGLPQ